jgi:hypothetical protein
MKVGLLDSLVVWFSDMQAVTVCRGALPVSVKFESNITHESQYHIRQFIDELILFMQLCVQPVTRTHFRIPDSHFNCSEEIFR